MHDSAWNPRFRAASGPVEASSLRRRTARTAQGGWRQVEPSGDDWRARTLHADRSRANRQLQFPHRIRHPRALGTDRGAATAAPDGNSGFRGESDVPPAKHAGPAVRHATQATAFSTSPRSQGYSPPCGDPHRRADLWITEARIHPSPAGSLTAQVAEKKRFSIQSAAFSTVLPVPSERLFLSRLLKESTASTGPKAIPFLQSTSCIIRKTSRPVR